MSVMTEVRPFTVDDPEGGLKDLHARLLASRWPPREPVEDPSEGVQIATMQGLAGTRSLR